MGDPIVGEAIAEVLPLVYPVDPAEAGVEVVDSVGSKGRGTTSFSFSLPKIN